MPDVAPERTQGVGLVDWAEERGAGAVAEGELEGVPDDVDCEEDLDSDYGWVCLGEEGLEG